jgi:S-DNA-T family DNA segregation ATPase FtsK/SpoIIIE
MAPPGLLPVLDPWTWSTPPPGDWLVAPVGRVKEPTRQAQGPFFLDVSRNCLIYGGAGSGKSTLLRTLAASLALSHSPRDLHMYCLDFDARTLSVLAGLPHCGEDGIFFPRDTVRIRRLIRLLEHELQQRREAGVTNLRQQRRSARESVGSAHGELVESFPFIMVLLDNFAAFRETFEEEENVTRSLESMVGDLGSLMRDGPAAGITFVLTASAGQSIASSIVNSVENRVALRLTDATDYSIVGRMENVPEHVPPGRGFAVAGSAAAR